MSREVTMRIRLTKISDERHRVDIIRTDGTADGRELVSRSFLIHDFAHIAVEAEAGMSGGFWGSLASGAGFDELAELPADSHERWQAEHLAAPFQSLWNAQVRRDDDDRALRERYLESSGRDDAFLDGALERMRRLTGQWKGTPYGAVMDVAWAPAVPEGSARTLVLQANRDTLLP